MAFVKVWEGMKNDRAEESFPNRVRYLFGVSSTLHGFLIMQGHGFEQLGGTI